MNQKINLKPSKQFWYALVIVFLTLFLILAGYKANAQSVDQYYTTQVRIYRTDGTSFKDVWTIKPGFDEINNLVYFNIRPNETEEFTIIHKIYDIVDSFDKKERLKKTEYILDDKARFIVIPEYEDPNIYIMPTGYYYKLIEQAPYSIRKIDIDRIEFLFYNKIFY